MKHTKGPWTVQENKDKAAPDLVRVVSSKEGICLTSEANAHLIAAAPEMLDALEQAKLSLETLALMSPSSPAILLVVKALEPAIRKAKGGA